jgi:hypothetical protein
MKKMPLIAVLLVLIVGFEPAAMAQSEPDQPVQEVFQTELVYPQEKGAFQFTSSSTLGRVNKKFSHDLSIEYGLTHAWQISLEWETFGRKTNEDGLISRGSGDLRFAGAWSEIRIGDTGTGIPEASRARVFDPFFTTERVGKGTGQGLAISHTVVERHGGTITFETAEGEGTTFIIRLPLQETAKIPDGLKEAA